MNDTDTMSFEFKTDIITFEFTKGKEDIVIHLPGKILSSPRRNEIAVYSTPEFIDAMTNGELDNVILDGICSSGTFMKLDEKRKRELFGDNEKISVINYH